jgi:hypothetical protein
MGPRAGRIRLAGKHQASSGDRTGELASLQLRDQIARQWDGADAVLRLGGIVGAAARRLVLDEQALAVQVESSGIWSISSTIRSRSWTRS